MELCLGTAQFGMDYGIAGGIKPSKDEIFKILDYAASNKITLIDTASGYGDAHRILGEYNGGTSHPFGIITKLPMDSFQQIKSVDYIDRARYLTENCLQQLMTPKLMGLLFHNPKDLYNPRAVNALYQLKEEGFTESIGVSVYELKDALFALELKLDMVQLPLNIFDRSFDVLIDNLNPSVKIFARSVYLQGLLLMDPDTIHDKLPQAEEYIKVFDKLCRSYHYTRREIALAYLKSKKGVTAGLIGVDNLNQLKENIEAFSEKVPEDIVSEIAKHFNHINDDITSPLKWNQGGR